MASETHTGLFYVWLSINPSSEVCTCGIKQPDNKQTSTCANQKYVFWFSCFNLPPVTLESSLLSLLDADLIPNHFFNEYKYQNKYTLARQKLTFTDLHFKVGRGSSLDPTADDTVVPSWWTEVGAARKHFNYCAIDVGALTILPQNTFILPLQEMIGQTVVWAPLVFLSCFVRGRKQLAEVWLCRRHRLSVHAERQPSLIKSQRR